MRAAALAHEGVWAVITGEDVRKLSDPFLGAVKTPVQQWSLAVERVRYVGEPVALVVAESRYIAEDAAELVAIEYEPLDAVIDPLEACESDAPLLHAEAKTNEVSVREFSLWRYRGGIRPRRPPHRHDHRRSRGCRLRRSNATSWSPSTIRPRAATTCWRISRARFPCIR